MSSVGNVVNQNSILSRTTYESKVDMSGVVNDKEIRVKGQDQDNLVNLATSQNQAAEQEDQQFAHQHHIALNAYRFFGRDSENPENQGRIKVVAAQQPENAADKIKEIQERISPSQKNSDSDEKSGEVTVNKQDSKEPSDEHKVGQQSPKKSVTGKELTEKELLEIEDLKDRDQEVRIHEQAHKSAGGSYASAPHYDYVTGPDGRRYADSGHVDIDVSEESTPEATIAKMQVVKRAALAPQEPSGQDRKVFVEASQKENRARQEIAKAEKEEAQVKSEETAKATNTQMSPVQTPAQKHEATENVGTARRADIVKEAPVDNKVKMEPPKVDSHTPKTLSSGKELDNNSMMSEGKNA